MPSHRHPASRTTSAALTLAVVAVLGGACGSGTDGTTGSAASEQRPSTGVVDATPAAVLVGAAERSGDQTTVETTMRLSVGGEVVGEVTSQGAADGSSALVSAELPLVGTVPALVTPDATYLGLPDLPDDAEWLRVDVEELGLAEVFGAEVFGAEAFGAGALDPPDPQRAFDVLRDATDEASEVGAETVDGIDTTRYRFEADVRELLDDAVASGALPDALADDLGDELGDAAAATTSTDVWIDAEGLVRRLRVELRSGASLDDPSTAPSVGYEFDFADYGEPVDVAAPDPATVVDASELWPFRN